MDDSFLVVLNAQHDDVAFRMPPADVGPGWSRVLDTGDELAVGDTIKAGETFTAQGRSLSLLRRTGDRPEIQVRTRSLNTLRYLVGYTAEIDPGLLRRARRMLDAAFHGDFTDDDWDHSRGGIHVVALDGESVIGHGAVVQRRLTAGGRAYRVGYVEGVGVHPEWQRRGIGSRMMAEAERVLRGAYDFGALATTDEGLPLYCGRGWLEWRGPLGAMTPTGPVSTPDAAGGVFVFPAAVTPDVDQPLVCDWRNGDLW